MLKQQIVYDFSVYMILSIKIPPKKINEIYMFYSLLLALQQ